MKIMHLLLALASASAAMIPTKMVQMEPSIKAFGPLNGDWVAAERVPADELVELTFVLESSPAQRAAFSATFDAVTDPRSPEYRNYLSIADIERALAPAPEHVAAVVAAVERAHGLARVSRDKTMVRAALAAADAEALLATTLRRYAHARRGAAGLKIVRAEGAYHLPAELAPLVSFVSELLRFPQTPRALAAPPAANATGAAGDDDFNTCASTAKLCANTVTPAVLAARYGYPVPAAAASGNSMAVAEFQFQGTDADDLANFASACGVDHVEIDSNEGLGGRLEPGIEALLDVEYIEAVAAPIPLTVYSMVRYSLYDWVERLNDDDDAPLVHSVSYGNDEAQQTSIEYMTSTNVQFQKAGARGLSILFASGDQGVWGREGQVGNVFPPDFPAASPYVTAVGGTDFATQSVVGDETTWADGGGGFSDQFGVPDYQADAVAAYFTAAADTLPADSYYNSTGRGYPDIAALGGQVNPYCVAYDGIYGGVAGTSAASPVAAGVFAQLNDLVLAKGDPPLGFLNPLIYQNAQAFFDVTSGINDEGTGIGFTAVAGWDPATGMGTPNYAALKEVVDAL